MNITGSSRFTRIPGYKPRYHGYDNVFRNGDRYIIGEAKTGTGSLASRTYSTRNGQRIREALKKKKDPLGKDVLAITRKYGIDKNSVEHVQGKAGWVLDYALRLKEVGDPVGDQLIKALKQGKVDWYEVGVELGADGLPKKVTETLRALD